MTTEPCDCVADLLVDYADGELAASRAAQLEQHLAGCPACRAHLARLERSLDLARAVWRESLVVSPSGGEFRRKPALRAPLAACAAALLLVGGLIFVSRPSSPAIQKTARETAIEPEAEIDFAALVAREAQAARLAAAADLLASEAATAPYGREALAYLASAHPDTEPGRQAARRANHSTEP
jgi:anti-sigma factor RsiW